MIDHLLYAIVDTTHIPVAVVTVQDPYSIPYELPVSSPAESPEESRMVADIQLWTGWSDRALAEVIGTTHPTVKALRDGRFVVVPRNRESRPRLRATHGVIARAFLLTGRDARRVNRVLGDTSRGDSPTQHLIRGDITGAYRSLLDLLRPGDPATLIQSWRPLSPRGRTSAPSDEE
jgi:hypothetical protein